MRRPARQSTTIIAQPEPVPVVGGVPHHGDDLVDGGRVGRVQHPVVCAAAVPCHSRARRALTHRSWDLGRLTAPMGVGLALLAAAAVAALML